MITNYVKDTKLVYSSEFIYKISKIFKLNKR